MSQWTVEDSESLRLLLSKAQRNGVLEQWTLGDSEFELVDPPVTGAMTDASKRRTADPGRSSEQSLAAVPVAKAKAEPRPPTPVPEDRFRGTLPPGVPSLSDWGTTLLEFGKYADMNWSYLELVTNEEPRVKQYCQWVVSHKNAKSSPLFIDLADYLSCYFQAMDAATTSGITYPGSAVPRRTKK